MHTVQNSSCCCFLAWMQSLIKFISPTVFDLFLSFITKSLQQRLWMRSQQSDYSPRKSILNVIARTMNHSFVSNHKQVKALKQIRVWNHQWLYITSFEILTTRNYTVCGFFRLRSRRFVSLWNVLSHQR